MHELDSIRYEIVIPRTFDAEFGGGLIPISLLEKYRTELLGVFQGITRYESVMGFWRDPTVTKADLQVKGEFNYVLTVDAFKVWAPIQRVIIENALQRMCIELKQKAIHLTIFECRSIDVWKDGKPAVIKPSPVKPNDRVFLLDKHGRLVLHGPYNSDILEQNLQEWDTVLVLESEIVDRYHLDRLEALGRATTNEAA
jgi:hypothetical protein